MRYGLGIDLGTTFTAAAVNGDTGTRMVPLGSDVVVPSIAFAKADGTLLTGEAAEQAATQDAARASRGHKRRLGDPTPLVIGGVAYSAEALLAAQLRDVVTRVSEVEGAPPETVVLTCPAVWGPYRREHFDDVPRLAGLSDVHIVTEPEAAATHYSVERRLGDGELVAVYDLGGGTFDTTILRARTGGMEILGTPEGIERMGGMDFDEALLAHLDIRLDGAISALDPAEPDAVASLAEIRAMCIRAKEDLSIEPDLMLRVPLPSGDREVLVTRLEFNDMIRPSVAVTIDALHRTISSAGLQHGDLAGILLAGGSSRIPLVPQMISEAFDKPVRVSLHPKLTVALGAAAIARSALIASPAAAPTPVSEPVPARPKTPTWLVPIGAAAGAVLAAAVASTMVMTSGAEPPAFEPKKVVKPSTSELPSIKLFEGHDVTPYKSLIGSSDNWQGSQLGAGGTAAHSSISVAPGDVSAAGDGMRARWNGAGPGQLYLQSPGLDIDVRPYLEAKAALVFDVAVHVAPATRTMLAVHCNHPCAGEVEITGVVRKLPIGEKSTVKVPVSCFQERGLDPTKVNTPFLISTSGVFDATFGNIRWEPGAATEQDATPCTSLR